ncbi:hypothetical protein DPMN_010958 [Dreissena polymorpha]|uniref:Uncharacterized protein n=1 Tax=Dreissena polymorpha TaxID=45954 RepID=A0A9D4N353_DREPO|nr:hypothetical protein DPMN_010958 [Dreissena polymorpha]
MKKTGIYTYVVLQGRTERKSTSLSPNMVVMGREIRQPAGVMFRHVKDTHASDLNPSDYVIFFGNG